MNWKAHPNGRSSDDGAPHDELPSSSLVSLVLGETTSLGTIGATLGLAIGFVIIMTVTAIARWQPVFDPKLLAAPLGGALLLGSIGGIAPAILAGRIQPAEAVRT